MEGAELSVGPQQTSNENSDSDSTCALSIVPPHEAGRTYLHVRNSSLDNDMLPLTAADGLDSGGGEWHVEKIGRIDYIRRRAAQEWNLLRRQRCMYITCITVNIYGGSVVFRNLAFYRYRAGERLTQDVGFELLPEIKGWLTGLPMLLLQLTCLTACALSFLPRSTPAPYAVNIIRRWGMMEAMGSVLRFLTYISTTLPGAADHCLPSKNPHIARDQPKTLADIFFMLKVDGVGLEANTGAAGTYNCGDLVFSGHMLMTIAYAFTALRYAPTAMMLPPQVVRYFFRPFVWLMVIFQGITILMARNHYTMDVVIASYVTPLLWHWYITKLEPEDMVPMNLGGR